MSYSTPGIYLEEVSTGPKPIEAVGTSTAGFVGVAPNAGAHVGKAVAINNWTQFVKEFVRDGDKSTPLALAVFGFFQNGGGRCYVANIGDKGIEKGLAAFEAVDEIAMIAAPGMSGAASFDAVLTHCEKLEDRVAILDAPESVENIDNLTQVATERATTTRRSGAGAGGGGEGETPAAPASREGGLKPRKSERGYGAFYFPWIIMRDPLSERGELVNAPPSGHMAGIYARTDSTRGVHKAPANEIVRGALNVTYRVTKEEQGKLNQVGVNCIRFFQREGILVWGGRTLADAASEWRYINVRRLFNMVEESIALGTRWVVFEPNDLSLWKGIRRDVTAFLTRLWRSGALMGATPEQAFFVQCDEETNTPDVVDAGQVVAVIGIAPVKPAEFIIFRIGQTAAGAEIKNLGG
jgi:hypothetical protein